MNNILKVSLLILPISLFAGGDINPISTVDVSEDRNIVKKAWNYEIEVYMFMANIDGKASLGKLSGDVAINFIDNTIPNLKLGAMAHFEAHHQSGWGYWIDYGFMNLGKSDDVSILGIHANTDVGLFQGTLEGAVLYKNVLDAGYVDYFAGFRWWDNDYDVTLNLGNVIDKSKSRSEDWIDGFLGARWTTPLNDNWKFRARGDIGVGSSDFTAIVSAGFLYKINDTLELDVKYKAIWVDYETGTQDTQSYYTYDTVTHGPLVGLTYKF